MISSLSIYYICCEYCVYQLRKESDYQLVHTLRKDYYIAVYITAQVYTYELHLILLFLYIRCLSTPGATPMEETMGSPTTTTMIRAGLMPTLLLLGISP
jgi:hypothetical protein